MNTIQFSEVEKVFLEEAGITTETTKLPYITVQNFPKLGLLASLRFFEWVAENPNGVISLSTGKTQNYFIYYTRYLLENWDSPKALVMREKYGLGQHKKPDLSGLQFVQINEFFPIPSSQHNSFYNYVMNSYIDGFGLDKNKALLIKSDEIELAEGKHFSEVFPDFSIDLSLRYREAKTPTEELQQKSIFKIDDWCTEYERKIREKGGIGFYLGGIGPDGHIAFNTRGTDHFSSTRLTATNFETQAITAADLGGIEVSRKRLVITIGLETITFNPDAVAIIYAAGESNADIMKAALENEPNNLYPATALQKLKNARIYLTNGAAVKLTDTVDKYYKAGDWTHEKTERAVIDLCAKINKFGPKLELADLKADSYCSLIPGLNENTVVSVIESITAKIERGMSKDTHQTYYHSGPHHDDIMLGIMPVINRQLREATNESHFAVMTSGFTAVTNSFLIGLLEDTQKLLVEEKMLMVTYPDFFAEGYKYKWDKDVYHYLDNVAAGNEDEKRRGVCHRLVRAMVEIWELESQTMLLETIDSLIAELKTFYDGGKNPPKIQRLKGMIREFEEELVWAHYGVPVKNVHHLRLGFYQSGSFTEAPDYSKDIARVLEDFRKFKPTSISLALDPEGSGPDTHYKVLQVTAATVREWSKEADLSNLRIIGYRNVWFRYHPAEVNVITPVSLNALAILDTSFTDCYLTQVNASFPSYQLDGKFSTLTQRVWVEQLKQIQLLLGKDFFYQHNKPLIRATHGLIYHRDMSVTEFLKLADELEKSVEGVFE
ncbi:MAG: glucosamine-6-phosphate isomerase [Bacteroidetes bacterium GWF2_42_66]|nr:MAG: glucosamine-6-phosphate isomerase [Bacteroidetes bacterium GWA2_42_15]OFX99229.1 MAG: glucosamine-6-phosphate isomerase [Bacteroidetes bacterium GWE2_42_39]OFY40625.1 MAG: glucosamine-6-phosphate isomerase [Bacteroidetes bacterium GWF2_42_66]HBL76573.1 glucosamine-6-phosphate isomerase [Prolixibacteraceae bacterium]HCR88971.1 glucosamine-6-phosphate isomerase [Prolixibacteraceae bacterium]